MVALGDFFLGGEFLNYSLKKKTPLLSPFKKLTPLISNSDILLVNLEGPLFNTGDKRKDVTSHLSNHPIALKWLTQAPNVIVNLANNHILDYGQEDFLKTIDLLNENNIHTIGAGVDFESANKPVFLTIKSTTVAFVAFTTDETHVGSLIVSNGRPGCASLNNTEKIIERVRKLKLEADYVVVVLHWGYEYFRYPSPDQVEIAHKLVNSGVDIIIGHHPHVLQGIENYSNAYILYSLGNFFFPPFRKRDGRIQYQKKISKQFLIAEIIFNSGGGKSELKIRGGTRKSDYRLQLYDVVKTEQFDRFINHLSSPISSAGYLSFWNNYKSKRKRELDIESLKEVFIRLFTLSPKETIRTVKFSDLERNFKRFRKFIKH